MILPEYKKLNTVGLSKLFDNKAESYKLFWFKAILEMVVQGNTDITFDSLINHMISNAWYMVNEYKLNLGPRDNLEQLVLYAKDVTRLKSAENKDKIIAMVADCDDAALYKYKNGLTANVPFRLQAPLTEMKNKDFDGGRDKIIGRINESPGILYSIENCKGKPLESRIIVDAQWAQYIKENYNILDGWVNYNLIDYLQKRNPSVPGIPNKLEPPRERKLERVKQYHKSILITAASRGEPISEIYHGTVMNGDEISIDHFVPWSYVAHDELWNLSPTTRSINSTKSNYLADFELYFDRLSNFEYSAYKLTSEMHESTELMEKYAKCLDEHVNDANIREKLYSDGLTREQFTNTLREIVFPVYKAAANLGFEVRNSI